MSKASGTMERTLSLNKVPEDVFEAVVKIAEREGRKNRAVCMLLLRAALLDMKNKNCTNITEYYNKLHIGFTESV